MTMSGDLSLPNEGADIITQLEPLKSRIFLDNSNQCHYAFIVILALEWVSQLPSLKSSIIDPQKKNILCRLRIVPYAVTALLHLALFVLLGEHWSRGCSAVERAHRRVGEGRCWWWRWQWMRAVFQGCNHLFSDSFASVNVCECQESIELQSEHRKINSGSAAERETCKQHNIMFAFPQLRVPHLLSGKWFDL